MVSTAKKTTYQDISWADSVACDNFRRGKEFFPLMSKSLCAALILCVCLGGQAVAGSAGDSSHDAAPRKIAMVAKKSPAPAAAAKSSPSKDLLASLPKEHVETIDNFVKAADKVGRASGKKLEEVAGWLGKLYQQLNAMPEATPVSSPYTQTPPVIRPAKAIWTAEGRIKTCVSR
jgi:hypothetical protein